ncbi:MAG: VOC family protein [Planctomycetota bacterium]|nr:VOC family protein [Planctomycetota bacterium]
MRILNLDHAQITIPTGTTEEGKKFYCGLLGLPEIPKPPSLAGRGGFWVLAGDRQVHVGTEEGVDRTRTKAHLAYEVDNLLGWRRTLSENVIEALESAPIEGFDRFEFRDPFGNRVEFLQRLA